MRTKWAGAWRAACVALVTLVGSLSATVPAAAAGNPGLDQHIVTNPIPSWTPRSASYLHTFVNYVSKVESNALRPLGGAAVVAARAWQDPGALERTVLIGLIGFSDPSFSQAQLARQTAQAAQAGAASFCKGATGQAAISNVAVPGLPGGREVTCPVGAGGIVSVAITWGKANVLAMVVSQHGAMSAARLRQVARSEYDAMATGNAPVAGGNDDAAYLIGGGLIVGAIFGVGLSLHWVRRRKVTSTDSIAVGKFVDSYAPPHHDEVEAMLAGIALTTANLSPESEDSNT